MRLGGEIGCISALSHDLNTTGVNDIFLGSSVPTHGRKLCILRREIHLSCGHQQGLIDA